METFLIILLVVIYFIMGIGFNRLFQDVKKDESVLIVNVIFWWIGLIIIACSKGE